MNKHFEKIAMTWARRMIDSISEEEARRVLGNGPILRLGMTPKGYGCIPVITVFGPDLPRSAKRRKGRKV